MRNVEFIEKSSLFHSYNKKYCIFEILTWKVMLKFFFHIHFCSRARRALSNHIKYFRKKNFTLLLNYAHLTYFNPVRLFFSFYFLSFDSSITSRRKNQLVFLSWNFFVDLQEQFFFQLGNWIASISNLLKSFTSNNLFYNFALLWIHSSFPKDKSSMSKAHFKSNERIFYVIELTQINPFLKILAKHFP